MFFQVVLLFSALYFLTRHILNNLRNLPPSPFPPLPIIGHLHLLKPPPRGLLHRSLANLSNRHAPVLLLHFGHRRVLLVSSPSAADECLNKNDIAFADRPRLLAGKHLGYNYKSLVWASYGDHWRNLRKISSLELLSSHRLQLLSKIRSHEVKCFISRLVIKGNDHKESCFYVVDLKKALFELMLNLMMRMIAGKRYYGENEEGVVDEEEANEFREIVKESFESGGVSSMEDFLPRVVVRVLMGDRSFASEKRLAGLQSRRDRFVHGLIDQQRRRINRERDNDCKTMIEVLLSLQEKEPEFYDDEMIKSLVLVLLSAGIDTSSGTMEWAMSLLLNNPEVLKKAQAEIDNLVGHNRLLNESDMVNLPYLHQIIKETMRMYSTGPLLIPHESSEECSVGGYRVPRGTMLLVNVWAIQHDPRVWDDPMTFNPERFVGLDGFRDGFRLMPFGSGRRSCPGEGLAVRMVGLGLGSLLQCFDWDRVGNELVDMTEGCGLTMSKAQPLLAKCRPRPTMIELLSEI